MPPSANFFFPLALTPLCIVARRWLSRALFFVLSLTSFSFQLSAQVNDTLNFSDYLRLVAQNHPIAQQANLLQPEAVAQLLAAQGLFDTKMYSDWQQKSFDGKRYFTTGASGIKTPTWYGMTWKAEYLNASGIFLDPQNKLPNIGQAVLGLEVSALQGLLIDERRTAIKQANQLALINANERLQVLNQVFFDAAKAYWDWAAAYQQMQLISDAQALAKVRFEGIKSSFISGDKPAIDTLESWIQVRTRDAELIEAQQVTYSAAQKLSVYVWDENGAPLEALPTLLPSVAAFNEPDFDLPFAPITVQTLVANHPDFVQYQLKQQSLEIDRRLKREKLKPKLQLEYQFLGRGLDFGAPQGSEGIEGVLLQNYKWTISFSQPLFLRQERAALKLNTLKIQDNQFAQQLKQQEIKAKLMTAQRQLIALRQEAVILEQIARDYTILQEAEVTRFEIGESSIFLVNTRENKRLEAQFKLLKVRAEVKKAEAGLRYVGARF
jgi:outer membrane protein TolC